MRAMALEMTIVPRVPILRTGHYDLESGPVDFSAEHLQAAAEALANDPAVLPLRVRLELTEQGHLGADGIAAEANGGDGGPAVGWGDNYTIAGNTLYADLHMPAIVADSMEWAFPARSIEGLFGYTTATGHTHDFLATGLLLLGQSWPGVTTLPDFAEVQAEFATDVAEGVIEVPSFATAALQAPGTPRAAERVLEQATVVARIAATGRPPQPVREQFASAGLNVGDLRTRWYTAEEAGELDLPESYDFWSWYVTETRALDDGSLAVYVLDESSGQEWSFAVESVDGGQVTFGPAVEVVRPDPVPVAITASRPRPALARFGSRAESRPTTASSSLPTPHQEDDHPMNDALRRILAARHGLDPETATEEDITTAEQTAAETPPPTDPPEGDPPDEGGDPDTPPGEQVPAGVAARTTTISRDTLTQLQRDAAEGVQARAEQIAAERNATISAAIADGRITPAEAGMNRAVDGSLPDGWRRYLDEAPEVTARALAGLEKGKYPGAAATTARQPHTGERPRSLDRALAAAGIHRETKTT
jgi:Mu-like prophage I protein